MSSTIMPQKEDSDTCTHTPPGQTDRPFRPIRLQLCNSDVYLQRHHGGLHSSSVSDFFRGLQPFPPVSCHQGFIQFPKSNGLLSNRVSMTTSACSHVESSAPFCLYFCGPAPHPKHSWSLSIFILCLTLTSAFLNSVYVWMSFVLRSASES